MKSLMLYGLGLLVSFASQASIPSEYSNRKVEFTVDNMLPGSDSGNVYYSCDGARDTTKSILQQLGAKNINATCAGGLEEDSPFVHLSLKFKSLAPVADSTHSIPAQVKTIKLRGLDNCVLVQQIIENVKKSFSIKNLVNHRSCNVTENGYLITADVLSE